MNILFVTAEASPFASSGGLGDVMGALPRAISERGHTVDVVMPLYDTVNTDIRAKMSRLCDLTFNLSWRRTGAAVYALDEGNLRYLFIENHYYFDRGRLYGEHDDGERFAFFSRAVIELLLYMDDTPDILHANDWQAAAAVLYLKTAFRDSEKLKNIKTVYTVHNIEYQGQLDPCMLGDVYGVDQQFRDCFTYGDCINLTAGAIYAADAVTTVSPRYAEELEYDFFSFGLSEVIKANKHKLYGVINGIDYTCFSPEIGGDIPCPYSISDIKLGKASNKASLQWRLGLEASADTPLISMVTRLTPGKGLDLVLNIIEELLEEKCQMVILGTGDLRYEEAFGSLSERYSNLVSLIKFDRVLAKQIYAASDIFLMPSKSEPCGLAQMISCSYGTVPVVRSVGGLYDSIIPYGMENANGFRFDNFNAHELLFTVKDALKLYSDEEKWDSLVCSAKSTKFTWDKSATEYLAIYKKIINR